MSTQPFQPLTLVTGATSGIGRATALLLAREGRPVAAVGRNTAALAELDAAGLSGLRTYQADLMELASIDALVAEIRQAQGPIGALVNAAGVIASGPIADTSDAAFEAMMRLNVSAPFAPACPTSRAPLGPPWSTCPA